MAQVDCSKTCWSGQNKRVCCFLKGHTRSLSLRALKELLKYQPCRFTDYAELTIMKVLDAHKDPVKEVRHCSCRTSGNRADSQLTDTFQVI